MKRLNITCLLWIAIMVWIAPTDTAAQAHSGWWIDNYDVVLEIREDSGLDVTETILANFEERRHGIYREIPIRYVVRHHQYALRFQLDGVADGGGRGRTVKQSYKKNYVRLRIGDADRYVTGQQVYEIRYHIDRALIWEGDGVVLRWNAIGHEWRVPIRNASATVVLPDASADAAVDLDAWTGTWGATEKAYSLSHIDPRTRRFIATQPLGNRKGMSVEITMPSVMVARPSFLERAGWWLGDNIAYGLAPLTLLLCFVAWYRRGRDLPGRGSIVVQYEPPDGLTATEAGALIDERVDMRDISAAIVDLAVRGFIEIEEIEKDDSEKGYVFRKRNEPNNLTSHEAIIYEQIFEDEVDERDLEALEHEFYQTIPRIKNVVFERLRNKGYFKRRPSTVRAAFTGVGLLLLAAVAGIIALWQMRQFGRVFVIPLAVSGGIGAITIILFGRIMPRKTRKGRAAWERVAGLEEYIRRAESTELEQQEARGVFERLLPYAVALGLTGRWAKKFEGIYSEPPDWYRSSAAGHFSALHFATALQDSISAMNTSLPAQPRSSGSSSGGFSGGGFSGGGGGGGGGGSW